jgi:hypothetical protein
MKKEMNTQKICLEAKKEGFQLQWLLLADQK